MLEVVDTLNSKAAWLAKHDMLALDPSDSALALDPSGSALPGEAGGNDSE